MPQTSVALDRADNLCALHHPVPISQRFIKSTLPKVELFHLDFLFSQGEYACDTGNLTGVALTN